MKILDAGSLLTEPVEGDAPGRVLLVLPVAVVGEHLLPRPDGSAGNEPKRSFHNHGEGPYDIYIGVPFSRLLTVFRGPFSIVSQMSPSRGLLRNCVREGSFEALPDVPQRHHGHDAAQHGVHGEGEVDGVVARRRPVVRLVAERGAVGGQGPGLGREVHHRAEREVGAHRQGEPEQGGVQYSLSLLYLVLLTS